MNGESETDRWASHPRNGPGQRSHARGPRPKGKRSIKTRSLSAIRGIGCTVVAVVIASGFLAGCERRYGPCVVKSLPNGYQLVIEDRRTCYIIDGTGGTVRVPPLSDVELDARLVWPGVVKVARKGHKIVGEYRWPLASNPGVLVSVWFQLNSQSGLLYRFDSEAALVKQWSSLNGPLPTLVSPAEL